MKTVPELVVIGGSAGALAPLMEILAGLGASAPFPILVVLHVTSRQPSLLPSVLGSQRTPVIVEPDDKAPLEAGTVYVAPSNYHLLVERSRTISLSVDDPVNFSRPSIDVLFESAADAFGAGAAGVVLSGANQDGAEGLARIVAVGGLAIVQSPSTATYPEMPRAALQRVPRALALPPAEIAATLTRVDSSMVEEVMTCRPNP